MIIAILLVLNILSLALFIKSVLLVISPLSKKEKTVNDKLKLEDFTQKDKDFKWKNINHVYDFDKRFDRIVNSYINKSFKIERSIEKVNCTDFGEPYYLKFYKHDSDCTKILYLWSTNKYYGYAGTAKIVNSLDDFLNPLWHIDNKRPSYKTMKQVIEIENLLIKMGDNAIIYREKY